MCRGVRRRDWDAPKVSPSDEKLRETTSSDLRLLDLIPGLRCEMEFNQRKV